MARLCTRRLATLAAALAAALALVACGSSAPTKQDLIARANAICSSALRDVRSAPAPAGAQSSLPALSGYLQRVLPIVQKEVSDLRGLPRPAEDRALLDRYITAVTSSGSQYRALAAAAARGDRDGVDQALAALQANPDQALAQRYGLSQCAGATGTGVS
jgi:hypothetical protein